MKDDDELERLLGEIPRATSPFTLHQLLNNVSSNHHHDNCVDHGYGHESCVTQGLHHHHHHHNHHLVDDDESGNHIFASSSVTVTGFCPASDGSPSTSSHSDKSPSPPHPHLVSGDDFYLGSKNNLVDYVDLSRRLSKMKVRDETKGVLVPPPYGVDHSCPGATATPSFGKYDGYWNGFSYGGQGVSVPKKPMRFEGEPGSALVDQRMVNLLGQSYSLGSSERWTDLNHSFLGPRCYRTSVLSNNCYPMGCASAPSSLGSPQISDPVLYSSVNSMNLIDGSDSSRLSNLAQPSPLMPNFNGSLVHYQQSLPNGRNKVPMPVPVPVPVRGGVEAIDREDGLIVQREGIGYRMTRNGRSRGHNTKSFHHENGTWKTQEKRPQLNGHFHNASIQGSYQGSKIHCPFNRLWKSSSLAEVQGYIYHMAKDQQGCRFLQRIFDEGTPLDVQIIFNDIIDHAVELMMNPFGNYLMQKLLEVCSEEQRMHILFRVTLEPGQLVKISLNTHGTRVVQKLIETLKTKQQNSLVISALEPGFLHLIKDLNGNHVIQRCLQCFPSEDSKFIFVAAAKNCVEIAKHQHGCCVLQRCINHSTGEHRENLVAEISKHGTELAEDPFGNYVVQYILELKIPYAMSKLTSKFEGKYVHLSKEKFSSHVVEKCLMMCNEETRANIIHELLSDPFFDQLLQDPHANYVLQTALRASEGQLHNSLVDAIESYKAVSRNSPYSKRIFSQKLLKR